MYKPTSATNKALKKINHSHIFASNKENINILKISS